MSIRSLSCLLALFVMFQIGFWWQTRDIKPDLSIVPNVPGTQAVQALTWGDNQFYFRALSLMLQNSGDTFGRFSPLKLYDFNKLYLWFKLLDTLDAQSNMVPSMASYYFSQTQNTPDVRYVVNYLYEHASNDVAHKWWWLIQSIYLSMHKLNDMELTLKVANPLLNKDVPIWAQQMLAVVHEKRGEMDNALQIMETIKDNADSIPDADLKYMRYFIEERLHKLEEAQKLLDNKEK